MIYSVINGSQTIRWQRIRKCTTVFRIKALSSRIVLKTQFILSSIIINFLTTNKNPGQKYLPSGNYFQQIQCYYHVCTCQSRCRTNMTLCLEYRSITRPQLIHPVLIKLTPCDFHLFPFTWYDRDRRIPFRSHQVIYVKPVWLELKYGYHDGHAIFSPVQILPHR